MKRILQDFKLSMGFLTLIPIGDIGKADLGRSLYTFPFVGLLIGAVTVAAGLACQFLFIDPVHIVVVLIVSASLTGGLHLDGLADTFDGLCSWRSSEEKLKIMKDSRVGVMGVLALVFVLLMKLTCLIALGDHWWLGALLAPVWGRWAAFYCLHFFPPVESGLASQTGKGSRTQFIIASLAVLVFTGAAFWFGGISISKLFLPLAIVLPLHLFARKAKRSIGGINGDICGAASELSEVALLMTLCFQFMDHELGEDTLAAAMNFVHNTDALIIDLRQNTGGSPHMVALIAS
ncbi:MAG: adenosylcobinamide-GDP ribazoletransferase [Verrucomicrobiota bacterium]